LIIVDNIKRIFVALHGLVLYKYMILLRIQELQRYLDIIKQIEKSSVFYSENLFQPLNSPCYY